MAEHLLKYRPSNGTEGEAFFENWCRHCARDKAMSEGLDYDECDDNQVCSIIADTLHYDITSEKYPSEWTFAEDGQPKCTAFIEAGKPVPPPRCPNTLELF